MKIFLINTISLKERQHTHNYDYLKVKFEMFSYFCKIPLREVAKGAISIILVFKLNLFIQIVFLSQHAACSFYLNIVSLLE